MQIYQVVDVNVIRIADSKTVHVQAMGIASSTGWTNGRLDPDDDPDPSDQVAELSFEADPPKKIVNPVLVPISASLELELRDHVTAILVRSRTNSVTVHISEVEGARAGLFGDFTTMAYGEEGPTTKMLGEEEPTTLRMGEEGPTTKMMGEEDPTTLRMGEEGPTTKMVGEEEPTTLRMGEEGATTRALGEEAPTTMIRTEELATTLMVGEEGPTTDPRIDDPWGSGTGSGGGPFGSY